MEKEWLAEYLRRYHFGQFNATTSRELELSFGIKGIACLINFQYEETGGNL